MLLVRSANVVQERYLATQGLWWFLPLRTRRTFILDGLLHVAVQFEVHDLQGQQSTTGKYILNNIQRVLAIHSDVTNIFFRTIHPNNFSWVDNFVKEWKYFYILGIVDFSSCDELGLYNNTELDVEKVFFIKSNSFPFLAPFKFIYTIQAVVNDEFWWIIRNIQQVLKFNIFSES